MTWRGSGGMEKRLRGRNWSRKPDKIKKDILYFYLKQTQASLRKVSNKNKGCPFGLVSDKRLVIL